jgi:[ribosomal protein S18]-alanine N-acetyltransferase
MMFRRSQWKSVGMIHSGLTRFFLPATIDHGGKYNWVVNSEDLWERPWGWGISMGLTYFKRYRMEIDLADYSRPQFELPPCYRLLPWSDDLLPAHADAKFRSFSLEVDANVFPCLGDREGCLRLMHEIVRRSNFLPESTWLIQSQDSDGGWEHCGTVQGVSDQGRFGAIQNLGITAAHRGRGLGSILLAAALEGFHFHGLPRAYLEVTASNLGAVRLYERSGFSIVKTVYKAADVACV